MKNGGLCLICFVCSVCVLTSVEVEEFWYRGSEHDLKELQASLNLTNSPVINLIWRNDRGELLERSLSDSEALQIALVATNFTTTRPEKGLWEERLLRVLLVQSTNQPGATLEIRVSEADRVFVSHHTRQSYDAKRRCFEARGAFKIIEDLIRQPGARKRKVRELQLPERRAPKS